MSADKKQKAEGCEDTSADLLSDDLLNTLEQASKEDQDTFFQSLAEDVEKEITHASGGNDFFDDDLQDFSIEDSVKDLDSFSSSENEDDLEATFIQSHPDRELQSEAYDEQDTSEPGIFDIFEHKKNKGKEGSKELKEETDTEEKAEETKEEKGFKTSVLNTDSNKNSNPSANYDSSHSTANNSNEYTGNDPGSDKTMAIGQKLSPSESSNEQPRAAYAQNQRNPLIDLKNADYIQFAQEKIKSLEKQLSELRAECEELALAGDHFKGLSEERGQKVKALEAKVDEIETLSKEEKKILNESLSSKDLRIKTLQEHVEGLEEELESRYNRIRVRERDLESRLEILKQEQTAVTKSKDEMILKLRSQNNGLQSEIEKLRVQHQKTSSHLQNKEDALRRTMKALKLSLTMLESQNKE